MNLFLGLLAIHIIISFITMRLNKIAFKYLNAEVIVWTWFIPIVNIMELI